MQASVAFAEMEEEETGGIECVECALGYLTLGCFACVDTCNTWLWAT